LIPCGEIPEKYGPIVAAQQEGSWLGTTWRVEPPYSLVWRLGLRRSVLGEPLVWRDENGEVAVAVRTWRVIRYAAESEPATFEGCDLLVRPDMLRCLEALHGELRELRRTDATVVPSFRR
jgi:hypothetical protein